jgi:hypothetical protein
VSFAVDTVSHFAFKVRGCFDLLAAEQLEDKWKKGVNGMFENLLLIRPFSFLDPTISRGFFMAILSGYPRMQGYTFHRERKFRW